jgi:hypothetical protein
MSNLIPTPIVDKNGKRTTVHKKAQGPASSKTIPSVALPQPDNFVLPAAHLLAQAYADTQSIQPGVQERAYKHTLDDMSMAMEYFSPETLQRITGTKLHINIKIALVNGISDDWKEETVNDFLCAAEVMNGVGMYHKDMQAFAAAFKRYTGLKPFENGHYPEERASQITAISTVIQHMLENPHNLSDIDVWEEFMDEGEWVEVPYLKDAKLRELIVTSEKDRDAIVNLITERSIFDADQIIELLTLSEQTALREGTL